MLMFAVLIYVHTHIQDGRTSLHIAAAHGYDNVLNLLLEAKADPELKDKEVVLSLTEIKPVLLHMCIQTNN